MQAAIGRIQLKRMKGWSKKRLNNASEIWVAARDLRGLRAPEVPQNIKHAAYKCYVFVKPDELSEGWDRDRIMNEINTLGVPCYSGTCSEVYLEKAFNDSGFRPEKRMPIAKDLGETSLMFLVHPTLSENEIAKTVSVMREVMKRAVKAR
jgi:dTDP-4-amino-4,6-dideoxygalactose transaminase